MVVPRTPRPPIVAPKPPERRPEENEIERWVARLARSIRLERLERGFLGASLESDTVSSANKALKPADGHIGPQRR